MDRLAIELMEDSSIPGRVFFQLLSGIEYGHFSIQTLGSFCIVHGRYVVQHKYIPYRRLYVPFQCTLDCAETVTVKDITGNENAQFVPKYLKVKRVFNIKATHFPESLPIDLMSVDLVLGCYREKKDVIHHLRKEKFVFLFRTKVTWKKYEFISLPMDYSSSLYRLKEVLFDKLTLFSANVILPKIQSLKLQHPSSFEQDEATAAVNAKNSAVGIAGAPPIQRPPHPVYKPTSIGDTSQSLSEKLQYIFLERSIAMDIFLFLMSLIIWLILYGDHASVRHTILFIFLMMILIVNARTVISFLLQRNYGRNKKHVTSNGKSFFVNGWNAWSFCGSVRQGENPPIFAMPSLFVKAFHHGGVGTSLPINLGEGTIPISASYFTKNGKTFHQGRILEPVFTAKEWKVNKDYIASDMFTLLTDIQSQYGVVIGFLSQKQHFGCISTNLTYDRISVHVSGDGVLIRSGSSFTTDLLSIYAISSLEEPFSVYMSMSSEEHQVRSKLSEDIIAKFSIDMNEDLRKTVTFAPSTVNPSTPTKQPTNFKSISRLETEDDEDIFPAFAETLFPDSPSSATQKVPRVPVGWCSWYHYFRNINEENLSSNLLLMKEHQKKYHGDHHQHGLKLFQIDDGYQLHWGDWKEVHPSFSKSRSLTGIVQQIEKAGLLSGIWLAPFACDKGSNVAKSHPEWILRKKEIASHSTSWIRMTISWIFYPVVYFLNSRPANSGNCGKFFYGLDITHPTFQKYLQDCFQVITKEWGFRYLKLDFLYSAILHGSQHSYYNRTLTKAQIMQLAMKVIYEGLNNPKNNNNNKVLKSQQIVRGSKDEQQHADEEEQEEGEDEDETDQTEKGKYFLLGCGSALGSMIGHVHANRISPDAGLTWEAEIPFCRHDKWNLPSARTMIRNTINRLFLHNKWWINDPDCLLLRDELPFTEDEIIGITTVKAISGGSILISDDLAKISPKRMRLLQQLLPPTNIAAIAVDLMEKEMPECFRNIFVSNHCKRSLKQQRIRQLQKKQLVKAELLQQQQPIIGSAVAPYSPRATGNPNNHTADDATLTESLLSPFEAVLYSKRHPHSPSWSSRGSPLMTGMMMKSSMFDSLDFVEERAHQFANLALSYSDDEKDEEEKLQNDSFDDQLDEDHAIVQSVDGKIAKGTPITLEMRVQGIKEKWLDKRDLHKRWFVFTVCNWSDPIKDTEGSRTPITVKTQFISLKTIFTEPVLNEFIEYTRFLYDPTRKANKAAVRSYQGGSPTKRNSTSRHGGLISPSRRTLSSRQLFNNSAASLVGNPLAASPGDSFRGNLAMNAAIKEGKLIIKHILHLFNFWNQSYSYRIIDLLNSHEHENEEETNEIAFPDIPCHSAQIYSIHLSLHPLLPKYLGSNLHFSCGLEIRHCFMTETLSESQEVLQSFTEEYLKQRLETERELEEEKNTSNAAAAAAAAAASTTSRNKKTVIGGISSVASASSSFGFTGETSFSSSRLSLNTSFSNNTTTPSAARYRSNRNKNMKPSAYPTLASSFSGSVTYNSFAPVVQTMCIAFEEGVLRDEAWNGYIWLYLPVNIKRAKIFYQLLGKVVVSGTAWNDTEEGLQVGGGVGGSIDEDRLKVIEYIEDTSSRAAGYVYRIKVASSKDNPKQQQNQLKKIEQALLDEEEGKSSPRRRSQRSGYISATSTIDEADSREERESASRDSFEAKKRSLPRKPLDLSNLMESKEEEKEGGAVAVQNEEVKSEEKKKEKEEAEVEGGESPHPSLSMSATLENIGMSGLVPTPLKLRFDQNDPGIILSRSESFMVMPQKQTPNSAIKAGLLAQSLAEGPMKVGNAAGEGLAANYASPSKPLKIASVANLHKLNDHIDYLLVSWISDMEERVARVDSPTKLFS